MTYYDTVTIVRWADDSMTVTTDMVRANTENGAAELAYEINEEWAWACGGDIRDVIVLGPSAQYWE